MNIVVIIRAAFAGMTAYLVPVWTSSCGGLGADGRSGSGTRCGSNSSGTSNGVILVNRNQVTTKIMFTAKRSAATGMTALEVLDPKRIVGCHMSLEIESTSKS